MKITNATSADLDVLYDIETHCFPIAEAATKTSIKERLKYYGNHFYLLHIEGKIVSFIDGMCTNIEDLCDEMYENASMHDENGDWQMIFGVNTLPAYRNHGYAGTLIQKMIEDAKLQNRKGIVLTCKDYMIPYYGKFGFVNEGVSSSVHGNVKWYQMRLTL